MKSNNKCKAQSAFKKLGAVALITATLAVFFTACNRTGGGGGKPTPTPTPNPPTQQGTAILTLSPNKLNIKVTAKTEDDSAITVEGCTETTLASDTETTLHARGTTVILKGKITELSCGGNKLAALNVQGLTSLQYLNCYNNQLTELNMQGCASLQKLYCTYNQLTALDVQGLTALQTLSCSVNQLPELNVQGLTALQQLYCSENQLPELNVQGLASLEELGCGGNQLTSLNVQDCTSLRRLYCTENKLNAQAMTALLNALPAREAGDNATVFLYTEQTDITEGNCKDFTNPPELKAALDGAKSKNWKLQKIDASGNEVEI